jgi:hypothetical protein
MDKSEIRPVGQHPVDPGKRNIDPIAFHLERIQTMFMWIEEHRASFERLRKSEPEEAERELGHLQNTAEQGILHLQRLSELLLIGCAIDSGKRMPAGLLSKMWLHLVRIIEAKHFS